MLKTLGTKEFVDASNVVSKLYHHTKAIAENACCRTLQFLCTYGQEFTAISTWSKNKDIPVYATKFPAFIFLLFPA